MAGNTLGSVCPDASVKGKTGALRRPNDHLRPVACGSVARLATEHLLLHASPHQIVPNIPISNNSVTLSGPLSLILGMVSDPGCARHLVHYRPAPGTLAH